MTKVGGFYRKALEAAEQLELDSAADLHDLNEEIAIVRLQVLDALGGPGPEDDDVQGLRSSLNLLAKLVTIQHRISGKAGQNLAQNLAALIEDLGVLVDTTPA